MLSIQQLYFEQLIRQIFKSYICRNDLATIRKVVTFANASVKRHKVFKKELEGMAVQGICKRR